MKNPLKKSSRGRRGLNEFAKNFQASMARSDGRSQGTDDHLVQAGWSFQGEPTGDNRWRVIARKGDVVIVETSLRLGDAYYEVETRARQRERAAEDEGI